MNTIDNHIARLGIQSTRYIRDGDTFASARQDLLAGGKDAIDAILAFVKTNPDGTTYTTANDRTITVSSSLVYVGAAMALSLCGWSAKPYLQSLILDQPDSSIRINMIKEIHRLEQDWTTSAVQDILDQLDDSTANTIRELIDAPEEDTIAPPTIASGLDIDRWIEELKDPDQRKSALNFLTQSMALMKLSKNKDQREQAALLAFPLIKELDDLSAQIQAAQLVYQYSPKFDHWFEAMAWCEEHFMDTSLPSDVRFKILDMMYTKLDHHPYVADARGLLQTALHDFIQKNDIHSLEVAANKILIINKLPQPPKGHLIRNKETNEQATLTCAECGKAIKPSAAITVALLSGIYFCSQECSQTYIMREKGSMNPRYW